MEESYDVHKQNVIKRIRMEKDKLGREIEAIKNTIAGLEKAIQILEDIK